MAGLPKVNKSNDNGLQYKSLDDITGTNVAESQSDTLCGCGPCKPAIIQRLSHPLIFTGHAGFLISVNFCAIFYFNGILTTIERQFQLSSSEVAALSILNDVSNLCVILFVTYLGQKSHRPRWIACGALLMAVGFITCSLPHFLSDPIDPQSLIAGGTGTRQHAQMTGACVPSQGSQPGQDLNNSSDSTKCQDSSKDSGMGSEKWIIIGQIIWGLGAAPMFPLTLSYIDDTVKRHKFTSYTAFLFIAITLGPMGGFFLTSTATSLYVDFDRVPADQIPNLHQYDPRWIGAWWLGFPLFSILMVVVAIPMFFYPKVMRQKVTESCVEEDIENADEDGDVVTPVSARGGIMRLASGGIVNLKGLLLAIKRLLCNGPLLLMCFGASAETAIAAITSTFNVKYLQTQFRTSPATAALLMGGIAVPAVIISQIVSAIICRRLKLNSKQCVALILICHVIGGITHTAQLAIGCGNSPIAGINNPISLDYYTTTRPDDVSVTTQQYQPTDNNRFLSSCNKDCACPDEIFRPVCGADGVSYISHCHAGCEQFNATIDGIQKYSECGCISTGDDILYDNTAYPGLCPGSCNTKQQLIMFVTTIVIYLFFSTLTFSPNVYVTLRLVEANDRALGLGLKSMINKCLGFFPAPILTGVCINLTCILWQYTCGNRGSCWLYDIVSYRYLYIGIMVAIKFISIICYFCLYVYMKPTKEELTAKVEKKEMSILNGDL